MTALLPRHPIRVVAERTGLTAVTLRAWERRYGAVKPSRTEGSQRLYSDGDIQRLRLIARLAAVGYSLADLAKFSTAALARMTGRPLPEEGASEGSGSTTALEAARADAVITRMMGDTRALDAVALRAGLTQSVMTFGPLSALDRIFSPFLHQVGVAWACKDASVAQEHLASSVVRDVLGWMLQNIGSQPDAPAVVATTVTGELHEFGAMMAGIQAAVAGWRVIYLGPNLPASEIARVAKSVDARVVALGVVNNQVTKSLRHEFSAVRQRLGSKATIVGGGAGTAEHQLTMRRSGIQAVASRDAFRAVLDDLWMRAS
jgi:DNA-binding transcriptional MerR regulator/methylmalonyl-CoA mutase cobalamin-binding subunit